MSQPSAGTGPHAARTIADFVTPHLRSAPHRAAWEYAIQTDLAPTSVSQIKRWRSKTWQQFAEDVLRVRDFLQGLTDLRGKFVVSLMENRYEWPVTDLAILLAGAIHVPLHPDLPAAQVQALMRHCKAQVVLAGDSRQLEKLPVNSSTEVHACCWDLSPSGAGKGEAVVTLPSVAARDWEPVGDETSYERWCGAVATLPDPTELSTLLYTSGTTGAPKGVMLSQKNLVSNCCSKVASLPLTADDRRLAWLPFTHIFGRVCDLYTGYLAGCHTRISQGRPYLWSELQEYRPTYLNGVPLFYHKCWQQLTASGIAEEPGRLQELLGGAMALCNCGGAPLAREVEEWFARQKVTLVTGYGLTEAAPVVSSNRPGTSRQGSVGPALPDVEIRIAATGEILTRGPNVMLGYFQDDEATAAVLRSGWLHTGDLGELDAEGFLFINGRIKDLLITNGGKNIAPVQLESKLLSEAWIDQIVVLGDRRDYLAALIVVNPDGWQKTFSAPIGDLNALPAEVNAGIKHRLDQILEDHPRWELIQRFRLLERPFDLLSGTATAKGSLRRQAIMEQYAELIDEMYR